MGIEELTTGGKLRRVTRWSEPVLHAQTRAVTAFDDELRELVRDMFATMAASHGVGLAATMLAASTRGLRELPAEAGWAAHAERQ